MTIADHAEADRGRRLDRAVGDHERRLGVAAPHHAAVAPEQLDLTAFGEGGAGDHLRRELDPLPADPRDQQLSFHPASVTTQREFS